MSVVNIEKTVKNDLLLQVVNGAQVERPPVWIMRQAGRILPEYRAVRSSVSGFKELVQTPSLAAEVTIQPVDILDVDAAIIFSDILVIPEGLGLDYEMIEKKGPFFPKTIQSQQDVDRLDLGRVTESLQYVCEAIQLTKTKLEGRVPLIGFAGAPWTIFCYMIEGQGSKTFSKARRLLYANPKLAEALLDKITSATISYLKAQINSGTDIVQVFDSWAGVLPLDLYRNFSLKYIKRICDAIDEVPVIVFAKDAYNARADMAEVNAEVIGLDWNMDPVESRRLIGPNKVLQGNLDPCVLYADHEAIEQKTSNMIRNFGSKHIVNLGHGLYPDLEVEKVKTFVKTVKEFKY